MNNDDGDRTDWASKINELADDWVNQTRTPPRRRRKKPQSGSPETPKQSDA